MYRGPSFHYILSKFVQIGKRMIVRCCKYGDFCRCSNTSLKKNMITNRLENVNMYTVILKSNLEFVGYQMYNLYLLWQYVSKSCHLT